MLGEDESGGEGKRDAPPGVDRWGSIGNLDWSGRYEVCEWVAEDRVWVWACAGGYRGLGEGRHSLDSLERLER